jgi:NADH-ubiquinone oxidoreductase chain 4
MLLTSLLLTPILGVVAILVNREYGSSLTNIKVIALSTSILNFFISLVVFLLFDFSTNQFQFVQEYHEISYFDFYLGLDGLSIYFVLLTTIIIPISLLSNWKSISRDVESYVIIILLLESLLLAVFLVLDILLFYIFFESILPPLFILIGIFGSDNRVKASFYLFLYTLLGSLFLLLSILAMSSIMSTTDFDTLFKGNFIYITQLFLFYGIFIAFAVKTPTIFLNTWLLKAHVESPLGGSIILAAIVLKLSLYGILRLILPILPKAYMEYTYIIFLIGVITIVYASLSTLRTIDIKELIAYSSVSHAAVYLLGVFSNSIQGIEGAITLGIAHGFVSPGLFICAGGVLYDRSHTRVISFYRGVTQVMPLFAILFFILCLANCGAPLTLNFIGEFLSLYGVFERSSLYGLFASSSIIFSAAYTIYMFQRIAFGGAYSRMFTVVMPDLTKREFTILMLLVVPTVVLGIYPALILDGLSYAASLLLYNSDIVAGLTSLPSTTDKANGATDNTGDSGIGATAKIGTTTTYRDVVLDTGEAEYDECKANPETDEHRIGKVGPETFDYHPGAAVTAPCDGCDKYLSFLQDTYSECIRCGKAWCNTCTEEVINNSDNIVSDNVVSNNDSQYILFFVLGDGSLLCLFSVLVQILCNKTHRNLFKDFFTVLYYIYKNKFFNK